MSGKLGAQGGLRLRDSLRLGLDSTLFGDVGVLAIVLFVDSVTRVIIAFKLKPLKGWGWMLAGGVVSVLLAWMVGREFPVSGLWVVGTMAGISLLFSGMTTITLAGTARKVAGMVEKVA